MRFTKKHSRKDRKKIQRLLGAPVKPKALKPKMPKGPHGICLAFLAQLTLSLRTGCKTTWP
ncbi:rCG60902 [Rattus norvegicus]|uniref:RCG60902 n=1 Tax=Rattus norvegicus TaxID=10116 RepID=A6JKN3_RAT|nr:rCG60902 [Rattus norvegicus]